MEVLLRVYLEKRHHRYTSLGYPIVIPIRMIPLRGGCHYRALRPADGGDSQWSGAAGWTPCVAVGSESP